MTIEYSISQNGLRIETFPNGVFDSEESFDCFNRLDNDNKIKPGATEIVFFAYVTDFKISYFEGPKICSNFKKLSNTKEIGTTIFVCETIQAYVTGRMLQTFLESTKPGHKVVVVKSEGGIEKAINEAS